MIDDINATGYEDVSVDDFCQPSFEETFTSIFGEVVDFAKDILIEDEVSPLMVGALAKKVMEIVDSMIPIVSGGKTVYGDNESGFLYLSAVGMIGLLVHRGNAVQPNGLWPLADECVALCAKKQSAYGPGNITKFGSAGVVVRVSDKAERLSNLVFRGGVATDDESIEDTLMDIANYGAIGVAVERLWWTKDYCPPLEARRNDERRRSA